MPVPQTKFRVRFDVPYSFAVEPGYQRTTHCQDFRPEKGDLQNCYRDPQTGLVMLNPSWATDAFYTPGNWAGMEQWTRNTASQFEVSNDVFNPDGNTYAPLMTTVSPANNSLITLEASILAKAILNSVNPTDTLRWVLESNFTLARDEGWVVPLHLMGSPQQRNRNILGLQIDDIFLHLSGDGVMRCYRYLNGDTTQAPLIFDEFPILSAGDLFGKDAYFIFYPIPFYGLAVYHSFSAQKLDAFSSSATSGVGRGHIIPLPTRTAANGGGYLLNSSKFRIAIAANLDRGQYKLGFHRIRYATSGTFRGEVWDPGYGPTVAPEAVAAIPLQTEYQVSGGTGVIAEARNAGDTAVWTPGVDRQGLVRTVLSPDFIPALGNVHTPFLLATGVRWLPVFANRNTTPTIPDRLFGLEISEDDQGRIEATCTVLMESEANRKITERGDATWVVESTQAAEPLESDWTVAFGGKAGGLARVEGDVNVVCANGGVYYEAKWSMHDLLFARGGEVHNFAENALDRLSIGQAVNVILFCSALEQIPSGNIPPEWQAIMLPAVPEGQNWRFGPQPGDRAYEVLRDLLLLTRRQNVEWRLYWNWGAKAWVPEKKPRDLTPGTEWVLTPWTEEAFDAEGDPIPQRVRVGQGNKFGSFRPVPPEANFVQPFGLTSTDVSKAKRIPGTPLVNLDSLGDVDSPDYLGRCVLVRPMFPGIQDRDGRIGINVMGRRVFDAIAHRRLLAVTTGFDYHPTLLPGARCILRSQDAAGERINWQTLWLRKVSLSIDYSKAGDLAPAVTYHMDSVWESEVGS